MIYDIIDDFFKWITEHNYYDKRILKMMYLKTGRIQPIQKMKQIMKLIMKRTAICGLLEQMKMKQIMTPMKATNETNILFWIFFFNIKYQ